MIGCAGNGGIDDGESFFQELPANAFGTSSALGISSDGSIRVGIFDHAAYFLGTSPNQIAADQSSANAISADGSTIVGYSTFPQETYLSAYRWSATGGLQDLGALGPNGQSTATAVSANGSTVVGESTDADNLGRHAFSWTESSGMVDLGTSDPLYSTIATGVSADGNTVIGYSYINLNFNYVPNRAIVWTQGSMQEIGGLGDAVFAISSDGQYVVGGISPMLNPRGFAFRWSSAEGQVLLPDLPTAAFAMAYAVSADGSVIVGRCGYVAAMWTLTNGEWSVIDLDGAYEHTVNWTLTVATGVSADGRFIVGNADTPTGHRGWVIDRGLQPK